MINHEHVSLHSRKNSTVLFTLPTTSITLISAVHLTVGYQTGGTVTTDNNFRRDTETVKCLFGWKKVEQIFQNYGIKFNPYTYTQTFIFMFMNLTRPFLQSLKISKKKISQFKGSPTCFYLIFILANGRPRIQSQAAICEF